MTRATSSIDVFETPTSGLDIAIDAMSFVVDPSLQKFPPFSNYDDPCRLRQSAFLANPLCAA
jgi:hypothetical protein